ncbi:MAG: DUF2845 domain-containing protein, partial [Gammaproteobacteria bacterium]
MRNNIHPIVFPFILLTGVLISQNSFALRCGTSLITAGDSKIAVRKKCGEPSWIDHWSTELRRNPDTDWEHSLTRFHERWAYNRGPHRFISFVTFDGGMVVSVDQNGRGFHETRGSQRCQLIRFPLGTASAEIQAKCGDPDLKEQRIESITQPIGNGREQVTVSVDEWTYNLGPTRFL